MTIIIIIIIIIVIIIIKIVIVIPCNTLWLFNIAMEAMALIEIDGLPFLIAWWYFPWQTVNVITRWYMWHMDTYGSFLINHSVLMTSQSEPYGYIRIVVLMTIINHSSSYLSSLSTDGDKKKHHGLLTTYKKQNESYQWLPSPHFLDINACVCVYVYIIRYIYIYYTAKHLFVNKLISTHISNHQLWGHLSLQALSFYQHYTICRNPCRSACWLQPLRNLKSVASIDHTCWSLKIYI